MDNTNYGARISLVDYGAADSELQNRIDRTRPDGVNPYNIFLTLAHRPRLMSRFNSLITALIIQSEIGGRERELLILRIATRCNCAYEFQQHESIALSEGISSQEIELLGRGVISRDQWSPSDLEIIDFADATFAGGEVSSDLWRKLASRYTEGELVELALVGATYCAVARLLNVLRVELEPDR